MIGDDDKGFPVTGWVFATGDGAIRLRLSYLARPAATAEQDAATELTPVLSLTRAAADQLCERLRAEIARLG